MGFVRFYATCIEKSIAHALVRENPTAITTATSARPLSPHHSLLLWLCLLQRLNLNSVEGSEILVNVSFFSVLLVEFSFVSFVSCVTSKTSTQHFYSLIFFRQGDLASVTCSSDLSFLWYCHSDKKWIS